MNNRIMAVDMLRGMTICGMILVNNPGGPEEVGYKPLLHAEWFGMTPTDLVFPFFMFIMGITTYLSLRKYNFQWSVNCAWKIVRRSCLLWGCGLAIAWIIMMTRGIDDIPAKIRILGVLPRLGICYGITAAVALSLPHKYIPWLIGMIYLGYWAILVFCNGYAHDESNIIAIVDDAILGHQHVYKGDCPDPEGLLSTLPAIGHVMTGFCIGGILSKTHNLTEKIERLFVIGSILTFAGLLMSYGCPISKKLWTPTFAMTTCGMASLTLALLIVWVDKREHHPWTFFEVFGVNPLAIYVISDLLLIPLSILTLDGNTTIQNATYLMLCNVMPEAAASLAWALIYILINWIIGFIMYRKGIRIKI